MYKIKKNIPQEIISLKKSENLLYLAHIEDEEIKKEHIINVKTLIVIKNIFFNTTKYQIHTEYKPIIVS